MFEHLCARIFNTPLMITQRRLDAILAAIGPRLLSGVAMDAPNGEPAPVPQYQQDRKVGIIPIHGTLVSRAGQINPMSEPLMSYSRIGTLFSEAMNDPAIAHIVLHIDSQGGESEGVMDLSDRIHAARGKKPITAVIAGGGYSAAYAIASAADRILMSRTSGVGSIGVIATHVDQSGHDAKEGFRFTHVYAGAHKADYSPHAPLSADAHSLLQADIDDLYALFVQTVARNRNMTPDAVHATQARAYMGSTAVNAGLADDIMSAEDAIQSIISEVNTMPTEVPSTTAASAQQNVIPLADAQAILRACAEAGFPALAAKALESGWSLDEVKARIADAMHIKALCTTARLPDRAADYIEAGLTPTEVRAQLFDVLAAADQASQVITSQSPGRFQIQDSPPDSQDIAAGWDSAFSKVGGKIK